MLPGGEWLENVTCPRCRHRHPAELSCQEAARLAEDGRRNRADLEQRLQVLQERELARQESSRPDAWGAW